MARRESLIKKDIDTKLQVLADIAEVAYDKLNFYNGRVGIPDALYHLGTLPIYIEAKQEGEEPNPKQEFEMEKLQSQGYFATLCVAGDTGLSRLFPELRDAISEDNVARYMEYLQEDLEQIRMALDDLIGDL